METKISVRVGKYEVEMRNFQSLRENDFDAYKAELWTDGKQFANVIKNGANEKTVVTTENAWRYTYNLVNHEVKKTSCLTVPVPFNYTMETLADELAIEFVKYMVIYERQYDNMLFYKKGEGITYIPIADPNEYNAIPIDKIVNSKGGIKLIMGVIERYENRGYMLLNGKLKQMQRKYQESLQVS